MIALRLKVQGGLITEVEQIVIRNEQAVSSPFRRVRKLGWAVRLLAPAFALLSGLPRSRRGEIWLVEAEAA